MQALQHLSFESLRVEHATELYAALQVAELYNFVPTIPPESLASAKQQFKLLCESAADEDIQAAHNWVVRDTRNSNLVGTLQATIFADQLLWIGYTILFAHWGNGFATASVCWLVSHLAALYPEHPVRAAVDTRNLASIRVLEKTGFEIHSREAAELYGAASEDIIFIRYPSKTSTD